MVQSTDYTRHKKDVKRTQIRLYSHLIDHRRTAEENDQQLIIKS